MVRARAGVMVRVRVRDQVRVGVRARVILARCTKGRVVLPVLARSGRRP